MNELYQIGKIDKSDYNRGFLQLLEQLTFVDAKNITYEEFCNRFDELNSTIYVIRNISTNIVVATGSIFIEKKFIHHNGSVGHIEDMVVNNEHQGKGFGKAIIKELTKYATECGCYKVILNCAKKNMKFYEKCGYSTKETQMSNYFK